MTGMAACWANCTSLSCSNTRAMIASHIPESTRATSGTDSRVPRPTSVGVMYNPAPPISFYRHFKADARAQGRLLKDHRERLACSDRIIVASGL